MAGGRPDTGIHPDLYRDVSNVGMARHADLDGSDSNAGRLRVNVMLAAYEHVCTAIVSFYGLAMVYGCFMDWYTNR